MMLKYQQKIFFTPSSLPTTIVTNDKGPCGSGKKKKHSKVAQNILNERKISL